ncbi:MAG TPA: DUF4290 domain-containing protein [Porphyromonadaceae bacterium]|nr:DUF4290 domain-containing protein [Porphyromonadaceae bacterium]
MDKKKNIYKEHYRYKIDHSTRLKDMLYNTQQSRLILPEYGRCLQKMVEDIAALPNKEDRNRKIQLLIPIFQCIRSQAKEDEEEKQKFWDLVSILSDFRLDIDFPVIPVNKAKLSAKPDRVSYPRSIFQRRHYGNNIMKMINCLESCKTPEERQKILAVMLNHMKKSYLQWNGGVVEDEKIVKDLCEISNGKIKPEEITFKLADQKEIFEKKNKKTPPQKAPKKQGKKGNK